MCLLRMIKNCYNVGSFFYSIFFYMYSRISNYGMRTTKFTEKGPD